MFKLINNLNDYKKLIHELEKEFECTEEWQDFFGFELKWNEETGEVLETIMEYEGDIKYIPKSFPCIVYSTFEKSFDRSGDFKVQLFDFIEIDKLKGEKI